MEREELVCELEQLARTEMDTQRDMMGEVSVAVMRYKKDFGTDEYINRYVSMYLDNRTEWRELKKRYI